MSALGTSIQTKDLVPYYGAKWQEEQDVQASGLPYVIFRPSFVFGRDGGVLPTFIRLARFVVSIRLHVEDMSVEQGMRFFRDEAFLEEATADVIALHQALLAHDAVGIARVAHRLKGSSANMGATQMAALAEELEGKDPAKDARKLAALEKEFELVREALKIKRKETELTVPTK